MRQKNYKNRAAAHQKFFIEKSGGTYKEYCILKDEDALQFQLIPWEGMIESIEKLRGKKFMSKDGKVKIVFKNMLRSEHIAYNFFMPLFLNKDQNEVLLFYKKLLNRHDLLQVSKFYVEWAPKPAKNYLNDNTSFDTYIEFALPENKKLGVGIEIKFTEKSYPFTKTELERLQLQDKSSPYYNLWSGIGKDFYKEKTYEHLGDKGLKQFFRNHLLGLSMINSIDKDVKVDEFISLHLYPSGNKYQEEKAISYLETIKSEKHFSFKAIHFEKFIETGFEVFSEFEHQNWLNYLKERYIVK